jgi:alkanesulfonate monooxygenase SsuD/methylene tetrahydromethanopterin reductase-like flavin-dependent oxidoreductase (luciferase family)
MRFGAQLWSQQTTWPAFRDAALRAEGAGWDSVWTWDHLLAIFGPWEQPIYEGWSLLSATAAVSSRIRLGLMVGANTFRYPGITAKLATTLDGISDGRAILGIGGAWFEREHDAFGIEAWGTGFGERLDRLDESVGIMRRLLDGERFSHQGTYYHLDDALCEPRPIQARLPILIGGSGPKKTLRTTARYGDAWNTAGTIEEVGARLDILRGHCADVGREFGEIELTVSFPIVIRDTAAAAETAYAATLAANGTDTLDVPTLLGSPELVADGLAPFADLGFTTTIARLPGPYDVETIDRMPEVAELLAGVGARG